MDESAPLSKTRRKQAMHALQDIGARLVKLNHEQLARLALPERLHEAVLEAKRLTKHEAVRRQLQFIGRLMRGVDAAPIKRQLDAWAGANDLETARLHALEAWRARLLADEAALAEFVRAHPHCDVQRLRTLVRNARQEQAAGRPPRHFRALFRALRDVMTDRTEEVGSEDE